MHENWGWYNGSLPHVDDLTVTCRLTACTPGSAPGPTLGVEYGKPLPFFINPFIPPLDTPVVIGMLIVGGLQGSVFAVVGE